MTLAVTPPQTDSKEAQAASVALHALSIIGGRRCMAAVRTVLTSSAWDEDDNQWECAEILAGQRRARRGVQRERAQLIQLILNDGDDNEAGGAR